MGLNDKKQATVDEGSADYFEGFEGQGLDTIGADAKATAYLSMVQPGSSASVTHTPGTWRNTATDENYGPNVSLIVLAFKTVWTERMSEPPFSTVGRYEPNSIEVKIERPKPGKRGFPKMINPVTDNKIEELFVYACMLANAPEQGIIYFSPTVGSMRTCKSWNSALSSQRVVINQKVQLAPIAGFQWELTTSLVQNPQKPNNPEEKIAKFVAFTRGVIVPEAMFRESVKPALIAANNIAMLAAPEQSGDVEAAE